jgi:hypothetical protein
MNFQKYIWLHRVPEWKNYYIDFKILNRLLDAANNLHDSLLISNNYSDSVDRTGQATPVVRKIDELFFRTLNDQICLMDDFMHYKFDIRIKRRFVVILYNMKVYSYEPHPIAEKKRARRHLKLVLMKYYRELHLFNHYISLNSKIYHKLTNNYKITMSKFGIYNHEKGVQLNEMYDHTRVSAIHTKMEALTKLIENTIMTNFFQKNKVQRGHDELAKLAGNNPFTVKEAGLLGLYIGLFLMCIIVVILLMIETDFFSEKQSDFIIYQFPIFRGTLVLFIYVLLIGIDVNIWERSNINFKRVFNMQLVYTNSYEMMSVGFAFLAIWMLVFLYCGLSHSERLHTEGKFFNAGVSSYFPPFLWVVFSSFFFSHQEKCFSERREALSGTHSRACSVVPSLSTAFSLPS